VRSILRPDGFAIGLFLLGVVLLFVPLTVMPGLIAMLSAFAYWPTMMVVKVVHRRTLDRR
jgi:xanthine/uracil/vitamin C permease (AzgA family)